MRMIPEDLTARQAEVLRIYRAMTDAADGITPSVRALAKKLGIGHNSAHQLIVRLRSKGYLSSPTITQTRLTAKGKKVS